MIASNFFRQYRSELAKAFTLRGIVKACVKALTCVVTFALVLHLTGQEALVYAYIQAHQVQLREAACFYALFYPFVRFVVILGAGLVYSIVKVFTDLLPERPQVQA